MENSEQVLLFVRMMTEIKPVLYARLEHLKGLYGGQSNDFFTEIEQQIRNLEILEQTLSEYARQIEARQQAEGTPGAPAPAADLPIDSAETMAAIQDAVGGILKIMGAQPGGGAIDLGKLISDEKS